MVTVFCTLARLGLDPRREASRLASLPGDAALRRLDALLARLLDVPAPGARHHEIARGLVLLLPRRRAEPDFGGPGDPPPELRGFVVPILWTLVLLFVIAQVFAALSGGRVK